ncbi:unnamed protein product [marine sediment metagenome]|uniref:Uncharacterized protein n=1 Tax=marine sediment metagenome TaxID=412755 RepID=X1BT79_9ZZZZ
MIISKNRKKLSTAITREKIKGKFFIVAREKDLIITKKRIENKFVTAEKEHIRIVAKKQWSKKFTLDKARRIFKHNNTFDENLQRITLKTKIYDELIDTSPTPSRPKSRPFRYFITALLKDGRTIGASSKTQFWGSILEAKEQAEKRFFEMLAFTIKDVYDADEGMKLTNEIKSIREGIKFNR